MKKQILLAAAATMLLTSLSASAQTVVRETTTAVQPTEVAGTLTEYAPDALVIRSQEATAPVRYSYTTTTEYVDDAGNRVTREVLKSGLPVTIRYTRDGDRMIVSRVIVHQAAAVVPVVPGTVDTKTTTTTTTTEEGHKKHHDKDNN